MDKNAIKKFAVWARTELISRVMQKALSLGIEEKRIAPANTVVVDGKPLTEAQQTQRNALVDEIGRKGYQHVMEDVAYTWFNRFIALRFMEVNGYLPSRVRVFSDENGRFHPQIIDEAIRLDLDGLDMEKVYAYKEANQTGALYRYLLTTQCNALSRLLPRMFQPIADYTELLLPDNLLREGSVIEQMVTLIPEEDWQDQVQIIGWLYQYYNTEAFASLYDGDKATAKIQEYEIPAATQLFTPDWIVRYMVENSLGRLWLEGHPNETLKAGWIYYLDEAEQEQLVQEQLASLRAGYAAIRPEDIRVIDPCMGSGHILVYMFDVLVQIYEDYGYTTREAVESILHCNLYGLDIDDRAAQLAYFAVMMKARQYDRRFLSRRDEDGNPNIPQPHVYAIAESNGIDRSVIGQLGAGMPGIEYNSAVTQMNALLDALHDAKEYGSILTVDELDWALLRRFVAAGVSDAQVSMDTLELDVAMARLPGLIDVGEALGQKYDAVVTNPPYLNANRMGKTLSSYVSQYYKEAKQDMYSVFLQAALTHYSKMWGYVSFITPTSWMHSEKFKKIRNTIIDEYQISSLVDCGTELFDGKVGHLFIAAYVIIKARAHKNSIYVDLSPYCYARRNEKQEQYLNHQNRGVFDQRRFVSLPDKPIAYKLSEAILCYFENQYALEQEGEARQGLTTSDNARFTRLWHEVKCGDICFSCSRCADTYGNTLWYPFLKGGEFQRWYQRFDTVVNYQNDGKEIKETVMQKYPYLNNPGFVVKNTEWYFRRGICWNDVAGERFNARYMPAGYIFADASPSYFPSNGDTWYYLGYFNSKVFQHIADVICKGLHYSTGQIPKIPTVPYHEVEHRTTISQLVEDCYCLVQDSCCSFEEQYSFQRHPLVPSQPCTVESAFDRWAQECEARFQQLKANEEELNRIFIDIYGLQDELTPEVDEKDVTVRRADLGRDIRSLISYAVGCMFGRYSLRTPGLAYAGGEWDCARYSGILPDKDNVLPICDDEYFEDDIVGKFVEFVKFVYGPDELEANLAFIASALGGKGTPREVIRSYFLNDFYKDHLKIYQKRPIYWLFDSGRKNGFKCLIYMHRYAPDTIARIRTDYVHEQQSRYRTALSTLEGQIAGASGSERVRLTRQQQKLQAQAEEIRLYEEKIHHLADQMITIDLDDGVKHNYEIFKAVLAPIK